ncbi:MAG: IS4 family transposase [Spongiibacteraceae bacterium]
MVKTHHQLAEVFIWIAKLGGYIGRRTDPSPGMISLWRGWQRLMDMVEDYRDICG